MAEEEVSVSAHEHIEPNVLNILIIVAVVVLTVYFLKWGANKAPNALGGLSGV